MSHGVIINRRCKCQLRVLRNATQICLERRSHRIPNDARTEVRLDDADETAARAHAWVTILVLRISYHRQRGRESDSFITGSRHPGTRSEIEGRCGHRCPPTPPYVV